VRRREFLAAPLALAACATLPSRAVPDGWAGAEGAADIGSALGAERTLDIRSRADLDAALRLGDQPKLLRVHGVIDLAGGRGVADFTDSGFDFDAYCRAYSPQAWGRRVLSGPLEEARKRSAARQASAIVTSVPSRTAIIGVTANAGFVDGTLMVERSSGVVLRNLHFGGVRDHFPAWDPLDGAEGEWNSAYDTLLLRGARSTWVDHCSFESRYPPKTRIFGRLFETNDGLLDITLAADFITVSWCRFARHDKVMLIGGSDRHEADEGHLRVTLHHNLWEDCAERTPRVRFGRVHVANNLFVAPDPAHYGYSIGLGKRCRIVSEHNAWEVAPGIEETRFLRNWGGTQFHDLGSIRNGRPVDLAAAFRRTYPSVVLDDRPAFAPPPIVGRLPASEIAAAVRAGAGVIPA